MALASHYLFEATFCNPAAGWEKGQIEKTVQDARRHIWQDLPAFPDPGALNAWLEARCLACWERLQHIELARSIAEVHASERPHLMVPGRPFDGFVEQTICANRLRARGGRVSSDAICWSNGSIRESPAEAVNPNSATYPRMELAYWVRLPMSHSPC